MSRLDAVTRPGTSRFFQIANISLSLSLSLSLSRNGNTRENGTNFLNFLTILVTFRYWIWFFLFRDLSISVLSKKTVFSFLVA